MASSVLYSQNWSSESAIAIQIILWGQQFLSIRTDYFDKDLDQLISYHYLTFLHSYEPLEKHGEQN